jgi:hypothetical protein
LQNLVEIIFLERMFRSHCKDCKNTNGISVELEN